MSYTTTKASARRWFDAHVGNLLDTVQVDPMRRTPWCPGNRMLSKRSATQWRLDGSTVRLDADHVIDAIDEDSITLKWVDPTTARVIHTTTYTVVKARAFGIGAPSPVIAEVREECGPGGSFPAHKIR